MARHIPTRGLVLATIVMCGVALPRSASGQGFLKRLQDRVQSQTSPAAEQDTSAAAPRSGEQDSASRRPLLDALLQYGPGILSGEGAEKTDARGVNNNFGFRQNGDTAGAGGLNPAGVAVAPSPVNRASLGIDVLESEPGIPGVLVAGFRADSKADDAGLKKGDVIVSLDRNLTPKIADIAQVLDKGQPGQVVAARVLRGDQMITMRIPLLGPRQNLARPENDRGFQIVPPPPLPQRELLPAMPITAGQGARPSQTGPNPQGGVLPPPSTQPVGQQPSVLDPQQYGIMVESTPGIRGVMIQGVVNGSAAAAAGLMPGDRVVSVDGKLASNRESLSRQLQGRSKGEVVSLGVVRGERYLVKPFTLSTVIDASANAPNGNKAGSSSQPAEHFDAGESLLGGLGSALGGLLGGATEKSNGTQTNNKPAANKQNSASGDRANEMKPADEMKPANGLANEDVSDTVGKPVRRTSFEEKALGQIPKITSDPPSLKVLQVPSQGSAAIESVTSPRAGSQSDKENSVPAQSQPTASELREQIRMLQEQLKTLEAEANAKSEK